MNGSSRIDAMYRAFRRGGLDEATAIREVFRAGHAAGALPGRSSVSAADCQEAVTIYHVERLAGRSHVEALDEVFLAGYVLARPAAAA